jgi:hypothetical protein
MIGQYLVQISIAWYALEALVFAVEGNWPKSTYFLGAAILTVGVVWMK